MWGSGRRSGRRGRGAGRRGRGRDRVARSWETAGPGYLKPPNFPVGLPVQRRLFPGAGTPRPGPRCPSVKGLGLHFRHRKATHLPHFLRPGKTSGRLCLPRPPGCVRLGVRRPLGPVPGGAEWGPLAGGNCLFLELKRTAASARFRRRLPARPREGPELCAPLALSAPLPGSGRGLRAPPAAPFPGTGARAAGSWVIKLN